MKLEDQVCSLNLAKRLNEIGVRQESAFYWILCPLDAVWGVEFWEFSMPGPIGGYSAFTVAELGGMLPIGCMSTKIFDDLPWACVLDVPAFRFDGKTEADARAKMLINLIEKGIVTL